MPAILTYGYLAVAAILILSAFAIIMGRSQIGRWVGVVAGAILAISAIWWMPYYPIWPLTYIAVGVSSSTPSRHTARERSSELKRLNSRR